METFSPNKQTKQNKVSLSHPKIHANKFPQIKKRKKPTLSSPMFVHQTSSYQS
jgi:hypothetical protein